jgi:trimethylamine--corrinoid protein Co-methyltransferase
MVTRAVEGIKVNDDTIALDVIREVGPGGNFVASKHTRRFMRTEHYQPTLSNRNYRNTWEAKGSKVIWERAAEKVDEILNAHNWSLSGEITQRIKSEVGGIV